MQFLPPRPSAAGSMAASPAPAGGGPGLFGAFSAQRNCLLFAWANSRVQNKRKCSEEVSRPEHRQRGFTPLQWPGLGGLSLRPEIRQTWLSPALCPLLAPWSGFPPGAVGLRKDKSLFYIAARFTSQQHSFQHGFLLFRTGSGSQSQCTAGFTGCASELTLLHLTVFCCGIRRIVIARARLGFR